MGNQDRTRNQGTPDPGETQRGSEKERSRENQPGQPRPDQGGVPGERRDNDRRPDEKAPKQYGSPRDDRPGS